MTRHPPMTASSRVILITGASSGIGRVCAEHLQQRGHRVFGASRHPQPREAFVPLEMDVDDDDSVQRGVARVLAEAGRLDVLVNNAGYALAGAVEDTSIEEAQAQFNTNFFGALRVMRAVLPAMRRQRSGLIVNISSIGGTLGLPFQGLYSASKVALEELTEALNHEVRPFGIRAVLIRPGDFHTNGTANRRRAARALDDSAYRAQFERTLQTVEHDELNAPAPHAVARALEHIVAVRQPRPHYTVGPFIQQAAVWARPLVPDWLFQLVVRKYYRLD